MDEILAIIDMKILWHAKDEKGLEKTLELMENHVKYNVVRNKKLSNPDKFNMIYYCSKRILEYFPWHEDSKKVIKVYESKKE